MVADFFDSVYHQQDSMPPLTYLGFQEFMRAVYSHSTDLQDYLQSREQWYPSAFLKSLRGAA